MKRTISALLLLALGGCASLNQMMGVPTNVGNGYKIAQDRQIYGETVKIEYQDHAALAADRKQQAANRMVEPDLTGLPAGRIFVTYTGTTIGGANPKWLEYVVLKDGEEVLRERGREQVPDYTTGQYATTWWAIDSLDVPVEAPFQLVVISNLKNKRDTFSVARP